jgi:hypothetical protein
LPYSGKKYKINYITIFYVLNNLEFQEKEVAVLKKNNKTDHVKKIFSTLNFKSKGTTYNNAHGKLNYILK